MIPQLQIADLCVALDVRGERRQILRGVSLTVERGEVVGLVGESGSGKSVTARSVNRLLPSTATVSGSVRVDGRDVYALKGRALRKLRANEVGMIFQNPRAHINPVRTVGDFLVESMLAAKKVSRAEATRTILDLLAEVGIANGPERMQQYPHQLSGGLLQRVMIASVLGNDAGLVLADEPTTALDMTTQAEVVKILNRLRKQHSLSILFITHDLDLAAAISDRTIVLYAGAVVEEQSSIALQQHPRHPYTAALLGGRPDIENIRPRLATIPGQPKPAHLVERGCSFADRCSFRRDVCLEEEPVLRAVGLAKVACHRADELGDELDALSRGDVT